MKIRITAPGRSVALDIENQEVAEAVFSRLNIMLFGLTKEYLGKEKQHNILEPGPIKREVMKSTVVQSKQKEEEDTRKGYKGFLYVKCEKCGKVKGFNSVKELKEYHCSECGADTVFIEELKPLYVNCECGKTFKYMTNLKEKMFDITCLNCGTPVAVKWNEKKELYETMR